MQAIIAKRLRKWMIVFSIGLAVVFGIGYGLIPKETGVLTEQQIRQIIREHPGNGQLEVKPETIVFQNLALEFVEGKRVWVAEYECEGRWWLPRIMSAPPFTRMLIKAVTDARTGEKTYMEALDLPVPKDVLTVEEIRRLVVEDPGGVLRMDIEVKPETIEFRSLLLVCFMKNTPSKTYKWVVEYVCEGRGKGVGIARINETTGELEIMEPRFSRMSFQVIIDARNGRLLEAEKSFTLHF